MKKRYDYSGLPCKTGCGRASAFKYTPICRPCEAAYRKNLRDKHHIRENKKIRTYSKGMVSSIREGDTFNARLKQGACVPSRFDKTKFYGTKDVFGNECAGRLSANSPCVATGIQLMGGYLYFVETENARMPVSIFDFKVLTPIAPWRAELREKISTEARPNAGHNQER